VPLANFETFGLVRPADNLARVEDSENLGERDSDREYYWGHHVGKYAINPSVWDAIKRTLPTEQLLSSLNSFDLLNREQLKLYNLIGNQHSDFFAGRNSPQLRVNSDGVEE
jgi:hypothetical protein